MNINNFFKTLDLLQDNFIPKKVFPKNAIFMYSYQNKDYILSKNLSMDDNEKYLVFYREDNKLDCIGIDEELNYINKLDNMKINIPNSFKRDLNVPITEALKIFDALYNLKNQSYLDIKLVTGILPMYYFYNNFRINKLNLDLLLTPFENNPIKKDLYLAQFEYFIKKYVMFRFNTFESKDLKYCTVSNRVFKEALSNSVINYCSHLIENTDNLNKKSTILDKIFDDFILLPLGI